MQIQEEPAKPLQIEKELEIGDKQENDETKPSKAENTETEPISSTKRKVNCPYLLELEEIKFEKMVEKEKLRKIKR